MQCRRVCGLCLVAIGWMALGACNQRADSRAAPPRTLQSGTLPIASQTDDSQTAERLVAPDFQGFVILNGRKFARMELRNPTMRPVSYSGYARDLPLQRIERQTADGWIETHVDWCGTGVGSYQLAPGGAIAFTSCVDEDNRPFRVAIWCWQEGENEGHWVASAKVEVKP
jgi:hypothetical protein